MKPFPIRAAPAVLLSAALLVLPSCSDTSPEPRAESTDTKTYKVGVPGSIEVDTKIITANVASVFASTREVVLDLPDGKREIVKCGPAVANFDQIRPGDQVKFTVTEEVAISMASESDPPDTAGVTLVALSPRGAQPGAVTATATQVTATVTAIDAPNHTATLQFPDGRTRRIAVRPDVDLTRRKVGEKVVIRKTDMTAIKVEKPKPQ